jgi:hypothetical protein
LLGCVIKEAPADPVLIQHDINVVHMDLDAHNACTHKRAEAFDAEVMVLLSKVSRAFDQALLGYGVGYGTLKGPKDASGVGKPATNATNDKGFKGHGRDSLALGFGFRRTVQQ